MRWGVFWLIMGVGLLWAEDGLLVGGWFRSGVGTVIIRETNDQWSQWMSGGQTVWRVSVANRDTEYARFDVSGDLVILSGVITNGAQGSMLWSIGEETLLMVDVRKCSVMVKPFWGDVILGRQLVRWGEGFIFSPMDFFSQMDVRDVNLSRLGVDALRIKLPLGQVGFAEGIGVIRSFWTNSLVGVRTGGGGESWYVTGALFYRGKEEAWMGGLSLKWDFGPTWYGEGVYHSTTNTNKSFWHGMVGMDYSFWGKWVFRVEYMTHTLERTHFSLFEYSTLPVYPFLSHHYISLHLMMIPTLIDSFFLTVVANLDDEEQNLWYKGQWWILGYQRNLYQNVNLLTWLRYQTDISAMTSEKRGGFSCLVSVEVKY
ncbi:MAG: hypothetical protein N2314_02230 [Brevinematales bacterium]|nr:hypothetical protein [Brevinematales bacterium]